MKKFFITCLLMLIMSSCGQENKNLREGGPNANPAEDDQVDALDLRNGLEIAASKYNAVGFLFNKKFGAACTATLISPQTIVTALHCLCDIFFELDGTCASPQEMAFTLSNSSFDTANNLPSNIIAATGGNKWIYFQDPKAGNWDYWISSDIAILKLNAPIFDKAFPALWSGTPALTTGAAATVVGYGVDETDTLQSVGIKREGIESFWKMADTVNINDNGDPIWSSINKNNFLYFLPGSSGQLMCGGDSGGPLFYNNFLVGINNFGPNQKCSAAGGWAGRESIAYHLAWIKSIIKTYDPQPEKLAINPVAATKTDVCTPVTITAKDSANVLRRLPNSITVNLKTSGIGTFHQTNSCADAPVVSTQMAANITQKIIYFMAKKIGSQTITVSTATISLTAATATISANAGKAVKILVSGTNTISANVCTPYTVSIVDKFNNIAPIAADAVVSLTASTVDKFYSSGCTAAISSINLPAAAPTASIRFRAVIAEAAVYSKPVALTFNATNFPAYTLATTLIEPPAVKVKINATQNVPATGCYAVGIVAVDASGYARKIQAALTVNLSSSGAGKFFAALPCTTPVTSTVIAANTTNVRVFFQAKTVVTQTLTATPAVTSIAAGTLALTSVAGPVNKYILSGGFAPALNSCSAYVVKFFDSLNNPAVMAQDTTLGFRANTIGSIYTDAQCTVSGAQTLIKSGSNFATVYLKRISKATGSIQVGSATWSAVYNTLAIPLLP